MNSYHPLEFFADDHEHNAELKNSSFPAISLRAARSTAETSGCVVEKTDENSDRIGRIRCPVTSEVNSYHPLEFFADDHEHNAELKNSSFPAISLRAARSTALIHI